MTVESVEKQIPVEWLAGFSAAVARAMGELGVGGTDLGKLLSEVVEVECVECHSKLAGADLICAGLGAEMVDGPLKAKLDRLRLGYCARRSCSSRFYALRFAKRPGMEWDAVWSRAEHYLREADGLSSGSAWRSRDWLKGLIPLEWHPILTKSRALWALGIFIAALSILAGCRLHGLLHKPRVFIVSSAVSLVAGQSPRVE